PPRQQRDQRYRVPFRIAGRDALRRESPWWSRGVPSQIHERARPMDLRPQLQSVLLQGQDGHLILLQKGKYL
ncbi:hypothetical protein WA026_006328, partial [Henosepilachna vigintioctopunctata]